MKTRYILFVVCMAFTLPISAQFFNFSLRTNNQQLIDEALSGVFVKITQSYELCDTISNEHFGRDGKDYFNRVSFISIKTEHGLLVPLAIEQPWNTDEDFNEYEGVYKPLLKDSSTMLTLNVQTDSTTTIYFPSIANNKMDNKVFVVNDTCFNSGVKVDSIPGQKKGWLIWVSSNDFENSDSVRFISISKTIDVPSDGKFIRLENDDIPNLQETICGGIYVTPIQTAMGQVTFYLTGYIVEGDNGWELFFPFIKENKKDKNITPIAKYGGVENLNPIKEKRK